MQCPNFYREYATPIFDSSFLLILSQEQAPAGSRDIPGSRDWTEIPIPGFLKMKSQDFSGFGIAQNTMFQRLLLVFRQI